MIYCVSEIREHRKEQTISKYLFSLSNWLANSAIHWCGTEEVSLGYEMGSMVDLLV